ncbi:RTC4-like domain-containing protein [Mycena latifolia]|nr:RTC4-like domain-containing protein [Mycena latifolia]
MESKKYTQRLLYRPESQNTGQLNLDLGSSFDPPKRQPRKPPAALRVDSDSDDELDSFGTRSDSAPSSSAPPKQPLDTDVVIKSMKFKKNKPSTDAEGPTPTSKENTGRAAEKKPAVRAPSDRDRKNAVASSSSVTRPLRDKAPNRHPSPEGAREKRTAVPMQQRGGIDESTPKSTRPKPRPPVKVAPTPLLSTQSPSTPKSKPAPRDATRGANLKGKEKERLHGSPFPTMSPLGDPKGKGTATNRSFPDLSPLVEASGIQRKKTERKRLTKIKSTYPGPSPLSSPAKKLSESFLPSPLGTPDQKRKGTKHPTNEFPFPSPLTRGEEGNGKPKRPETRPFPMSTQAFESSSSKRRSIGSDSDDERDRKRYKNQPVVLAESYYEEDSELLFISPNTDPKTLCPYCDTPLPAEPTPLLTRLLEQTFNKSYRDVRPSNPLGRKAPMGVFVAVCQRHRFESQTLPEAEARGWPKSINWAALKGRVLEMEEDLSYILEDPGDPIVYGNGEETEERQKPESEPKRSKGPRMQCIFWKDLLKDLKKQGTKGVKGVRGQFANFEKTQPGYYGELGSVIIHQTLYDMFPLTTIDPDLVDPLTPNEFIQRILVPEVGMRLVIEDMDLDVADRSDKKQAVAVLRESASYGVAMFPEDGGDWAGASGKKKSADDEVMGVAEQMVMERARKRRKELEIEEREEDEMWRLQQEEEEAEKKREKAEIAKEKRKARRNGKEKSVEPAVVDQTTIVRPRPRPVPKIKPKPVSNADSASGMDTDSSSDPRRFRSDSDMDLTTSQNSTTRDLGPTPKPRSRHVERTYTSDSSDNVRMVSPLKRAKSKSRSTRATPASNDAERSGSPSLTVSGSRQSTRGSSVVDLCSSSEEGGSDTRGSRSRKPPLKPAVAPVQKPKFFHFSASSEEDEVEATPRAKDRHARKGQPHGVGASSSSFVPMAAAQRRAPIAKGERSTGHKGSEWIHSMGEDICDVDDNEFDGAGGQKSDSWLLDDVSHSP